MVPSVLVHAAEEARHASLLKRLALKVGGAELGTYQSRALLCGEKAEAYFQALDRGTAHVLSSHSLPGVDISRLTYAYVTWLVERRALDVYGTYMEEAHSLGMATHFAGLLKEEDGHLAEMELWIEAVDPRKGTNRNTLVELESRLFDEFLRALSLVIGLEPMHAFP